MKNNKGFSLVELIVVIAIMAILAAVAIPTFAHFIKKSHEASDAELLHNINYIFNLSCLDNGVDIKDVIGADFDVDTMTLSGVKVKGASDEKNAAIEASFDLHFGELKEEKFYYIERLVFDYVNKEFVEYVEGETQEHKYGEYTVYLNSKDIEALKNSTFAEDIDGLLEQVDNVTDLAAGFIGENKLDALLGSEGFLNSFANALGLADLDDILAALEAESIKIAEEAVERRYGWKRAHIGDKVDRITYNEKIEEQLALIKANAVVLYAAQCTANTDRATINGWVQNPNSKEIKDNLKSDADSAIGLTKASLMCGMYTSYLNSTECKYPVGDERREVTAINVVDAIDTDDDFKAYIKDSKQATIDLDGYLASLNMIYMSTTNNPEAVRELLINGFADPNLKALMGNAVGNTNQ